MSEARSGRVISLDDYRKGPRHKQCTCGFTLTKVSSVGLKARVTESKGGRCFDAEALGLVAGLDGIEITLTCVCGVPARLTWEQGQWRVIDG